LAPEVIAHHGREASADTAVVELHICIGAHGLIHLLHRIDALVAAAISAGGVRQGKRLPAPPAYQYLAGPATCLAFSWKVEWE